MVKNVSDMTRGSPTKLILRFALPLVAGNLFQQLYTMTDGAIVGQFAGSEALGAIGCTDWLSWLVFGVIVGFMQGFGILLSQRFGAGNLRDLHRAESTILFMAGAVTAFFTALSLALAAPVLRLMGTQPRLYGMARTYLIILCAGMPVTAANNLLSSFLRALGNSRAPLWAMVASSATNIALDLLFVGVFHWGVAGAGAATVIAQALAALVCLAAVRRIEILRLSREEMRFDRADAVRLMKLAAPMSLQYFLIAAGGLALQSVVNAQGVAFVTAFAATGKFCGLQEQAAVALGLAVTTYVGQNLGAGRYDRIRGGIRSMALAAVLISTALAGLMFCIDRPGLSLFIEKGAPPEVMEVALNYLHAMSATLVVLYLLYVVRSALLGLGRTMITALSSLVQCFMRMSVAFIGVRLLGRDVIYFGESLAWLGALVMVTVVYRRHMAGKTA